MNPFLKQIASELSTFILSVALLLMPVYSNAQTSQSSKNVFNVLDYGAVGDGTTLDTAAIQKTIDAAAEAGNGARVLVPAGHRFLIGTIELKSNIDFHLQGDAELLVSTNQEDYTHRAAIIACTTRRALVRALRWVSSVAWKSISTWRTLSGSSEP